jgi:apolipoprotein N-acyltransferase
MLFPIFERMNSNLFKSVLSAVLLTFAWPIDGLSILIFVAFVPLLQILNDQVDKKSKRTTGYFFLSFFLWNLGISWWIWNASPFGMWFAVIVNSWLMTIVFMIARMVIRKLSPQAGLLFLTTFWMSFELLHLHWDFSWPWFQLGNVFSETTSWIQWYEYTGVFGGSLWVWIVNILCFQAIRGASVEFRKLALGLIAIGIPVCISLLVYANHNLQNNPTVDIVIAQPNIDPYDEKFVATDLDQCKSLFDLVEPKLSPTTDLILAPETYFTEGFGSYLPNFSSSPLYHAVEKELDQIGTAQLMSGIQFYQVYTEKDKTASSNQFGNQWADFYNSAFLSNTSPVEVYHKSKLVVGVETLPYKEVIEPIFGNIMLDLGGTVRSRATGEERNVFQLNNGTKVGPIICYESVYGSFISGFVRNGAEFLAVMTNDAWWGTTPGHRQLLSYTKLRAIETRLPIVRSANSGISAIINPYGEVTHQIPYLKRGALSSKITPQKQITFYVQYGDYIARLSLFISTLLLLLAIARKKLIFR